jgi:hypothetical protein
MLVLINIFAAPTAKGEAGPVLSVMTLLFLFPIIIIMVTGDVTVQGKENLFIYRKAPLGVDGYLRAMLVKGWLVIIPLASITGVLVTSGTHLGLFVTSLAVLIVAAQVVLVIGLFMLNPAFSEKSPRIWANMFIIIGLQVALLILSTLPLAISGGTQENPDSLLFLAMGYLVPINWLVAAVLFYLGRYRLHRIE